MRDAMKKCTICGKPIVLSPSAAERAKSDACGRPPEYYTNLFDTHSECALAKRAADTVELMRRVGAVPSKPVR